jgi:hypothetical protein
MYKIAKHMRIVNSKKFYGGHNIDHQKANEAAQQQSQRETSEIQK